MSGDLGRSETVTFLRGEDEAELRRLREEAARLEPDTPARKKAEKAANDFAAEAEKRGERITMRSVGRKTWRRLLNEHPARDDSEADKSLGANADTFGEAIVPVCLASPTFSTDEEREAFLDSLSEAQFGRLEVVAFALNMSVGADPTQRLGSAAART